MEINAWIDGYKVRAFPWIDGAQIYFNVQYFSPGSSLERPPAWNKTVYIKDNAEGRNLVHNFTSSLVSYVARMKIPKGAEVTLSLCELL
ncbi:MAG TPA: hypothetical protein DEB10_00495 [Ruminococcaceae bacterium]|jgi:hypothetical protein|nr:hypothetical protein [Oscillospiraceae bacterium]